MNFNFKLETASVGYVYSEYKMVTDDVIKYIFPAKNATKKAISLTENIEQKLIDLLNIGKKAYFKEPIYDIDMAVLNFVHNYGLLGFMANAPINKYYILENDIVFRKYNYIEHKEELHTMPIENYFKIFFRNTNNLKINKLISSCRKQFNTCNFEKEILTNLNENLIYSMDYYESRDDIIYYALELYTTLYELTNNNNSVKIPDISNVHNLSVTISNTSNSEMGLNAFNLKQAIDLTFAIQLAQDVKLLKICNFCNNAFIAKNPKAEYDTYNCKNKANVYKSRNKSLNK